MRSIGARLSIGYALASAATLAGLFILGYFLLERQLIHSLDLLNQSEFEEIRQSLGPDLSSLTSARINDRIRRTTEAASVLFYIDIHEKGRGMLFVSSNVGRGLIPDVPGKRRFNGRVAGLGELRIGEFRLGQMDVIVATSLEQVRRLMDGYAETSLVLVCLMLVVSIITGVALSRAAMRPVRLIQQTANHIRSDNLSERIPVGDVRDEISNLARLLNEMFDRLEAAFQQIRRFTAEASHELKTPLSLVRLQAEKLLVEGGLTAAQEEAMQVQLEELARLNQIIEDLLFLSRAEAQAVRLDFRREDPGAFLEAFALDARELAEHRNMRFTATLTGRGEVEFDPKWLRQVLFNLVTNALNASPPGGRVTLSSEFTVDAWRVAIEDEGPGVPPRQRERIFDRFFRLSSAAGETTGSGLGLAISRSIVGLHHGVIRAEAASGESGLRVVFELPLAVKVAAAPAIEPKRPARRAPVAGLHTD